jgi:hypothetical protein
MAAAASTAAAEVEEDEEEEAATAAEEEAIVDVQLRLPPAALPSDESPDEQSAGQALHK